MVTETQQIETSANDRPRRRRRSRRRNARRALVNLTRNATSQAPPDASPQRARPQTSNKPSSSAQWLAALPPLLQGLNRVARSIEKTARQVREAQSVAAPTSSRTGSKSNTTPALELNGMPDFNRMSKTGLMLAKVAASYRLYELQSAFMAPEKAAKLLDSVHAENASRAYRTTAEHGGAFLKVGQLLSGRSDLMPAPWIAQLRKLQDDAPAIHFSDVRKVIECEFGETLESLYTEFDPQPIAAASIGQVHKAVTTDGVAVAVKVQRPGISNAIFGDMQVLNLFVKAMSDSLPDIDHSALLQKMQSSLDLELDYALEAHNTRTMATFLGANVDGVSAPRVVDELCGHQVLTTGFVEGENLSRVLDKLHASAQGDGSDAAQAHAALSDLLGKLLESYLRQVLQAGTFQADPHPGNFLVTPDGELVVLDFGCTQPLSEEQRKGYGAILTASFSGDRERLATQLFAAGFTTKSGRPDTLLNFCDGLLAQLTQLMTDDPSQVFSAEAWHTRAAGLWADLQADPVTALPPDFIMLARVFMSLGGLITHYQPTINVERHMLPVLAELS